MLLSNALLLATLQSLKPDNRMFCSKDVSYRERCSVALSCLDAGAPVTILLSCHSDVLLASGGGASAANE